MENNDYNLITMIGNKYQGKKRKPECSIREILGKDIDTYLMLTPEEKLLRISILDTSFLEKFLLIASEKTKKQIEEIFEKTHKFLNNDFLNDFTYAIAHYEKIKYAPIERSASKWTEEHLNYYGIIKKEIKYQSGDYVLTKEEVDFLKMNDHFNRKSLNTNRNSPSSTIFENMCKDLIKKKEDEFLIDSCLVDILLVSRRGKFIVNLKPPIKITIEETLRSVIPDFAIKGLNSENYLIVIEDKNFQTTEISNFFPQIAIELIACASLNENKKAVAIGIAHMKAQFYQLSLSKDTKIINLIASGLPAEENGETIIEQIDEEIDLLDPEGRGLFLKRIGYFLDILI